jgi:asparagine synthase (glutamine-hydrolysing)
MLVHLAGRGGDGRGVWRHGPVALALDARWTTPEAVGDASPAVDPATGCVAVFDGRLDNRDDLSVALGVPPDASDAAFLLAAYAKWGEDAGAHLLGDLAAAVWDPRAQSLLCLRDRFGIRPFYFAVTPRAFVFASEISAVLAYPGVSTDLNEGMLAEHLLFDIHSDTDTLFAAVSRLRPRHTLRVTAGETRLREYWFPNLDRRSFASDAACAEEFLDLFRSAVRACLRRTGPPATHLSGGLDSSAVTAAACQVVPPEALITCSNVYPGEPADESFYIRQTAARYPFEANLVPFAPPPDPGYFAERAARYRDFPGFPNGGALFHDATLLLRRRGVRAVLGGQCGNHLLEGFSSVIADDLFSLRLADFYRSCRGYRYGASFWRTAWWGAIRPALPKPAWLRGLAGRPGHSFAPLSAEFVRRSGIAGRLAPTPDWRRYGSRALRDVVTTLFSPHSTHFLEHIDRAGAEYGVEERIPFLDTRLVEFCLRMPESMRQRDGVWKNVLRQAMAPYLPEAVLRRRVQAEFSAPSCRIIDTQRLPDPEPLAGYLDAATLRALRADYRAGIGTRVYRGWSIAGVNYFLAAEAGGVTAPAIPPRAG